MLHYFNDAGTAALNWMLLNPYRRYYSLSAAQPSPGLFAMGFKSAPSGCSAHDDEEKDQTKKSGRHQASRSIVRRFINSAFTCLVTKFLQLTVTLSAGETKTDQTQTHQRQD